MKNRLHFFILLIVISILNLGCPEGIPELYTVTFESNGGSEITAQTVVENELISAPASPVRSGYGFAGWYSDEALSLRWVFDKPVTHNMTLYARWNPLSELSPPVISPEAGTYSTGQTIYITAYDGANIYYTLDDSDPASSPARELYVNELTVSNNTTVRAIAEKAGYARSPAAAKEYIIVNDLTVSETSGEITISAYTGSETDLVIHSEIDGYPVTTIADNTFQDNTSIETVIIPDSVTTIGRSAFQGCSNLKTANIPDFVDRVENYTFRDCSSLADISIGTSVRYLYSGVFRGCTALSNIVLPDSLTNISDGVFLYCSGLSAIDLPDNLTFIGSVAFGYCDGISTVEIPASVTHIASGAFSECDSLTTFSVEPGNTNYQVIDDVIFNTDGTILVQYPTGAVLTDYNLPNIVTEIAGSAFQGASNIETVNLSSATNLSTIGVEAFQLCTSLTAITIPNHVTSLGAAAFQGCSGLESVSIGDGIEVVETYTFNKCTSVDTVNIGSGITDFEDWAFASCYDLQSVYIERSTLPIPSVQSHSFYYNNINRKFYVNGDLLTAYRDDVTFGWQNYDDDDFQSY